MDRDEIQDNVRAAAQSLIDATVALFDRHPESDGTARRLAEKRAAEAHRKFIADLEDNGLI